MEEIWRYLGDFVENLHRWQTLIAGMLALLGAFITVKAIRAQIKLQEQQHLAVRENKDRAARAKMPDALRSISEFSSSVALSLDQRDGVVPLEPVEAIETLASVIEHIELSAGQRASELVEHFQVHNSRLKTYFSEVNPIQEIDKLDKEERFYDLAVLRALTNSLYDYARRRADVGPIESLASKNILNGLSDAVGIERYLDDEPEYIGIIDTINRRHPD